MGVEIQPQFPRGKGLSLTIAQLRAAGISALALHGHIQLRKQRALADGLLHFVELTEVMFLFIYHGGGQIVVAVAVVVAGTIGVAGGFAGAGGVAAAVVFALATGVAVTVGVAIAAKGGFAVVGTIAATVVVTAIGKSASAIVAVAATAAGVGTLTSNVPLVAISIPFVFPHSLKNGGRGGQYASGTRRDGTGDGIVTMHGLPSLRRRVAGRQGRLHFILCGEGR